MRAREAHVLYLIFNIHIYFLLIFAYKFKIYLLAIYTFLYKKFISVIYIYFELIYSVKKYIFPTKMRVG